MRRVEYLRHLERAAKSAGLSPAGQVDRSTKPLLPRSPATDGAVAAIMRRIGMSDRQVIDRFGYEPATPDIPQDSRKMVAG